MTERPRVAVVTGSAGGIGLGIVERLAADGWITVITDISEDAGRGKSVRRPVHDLLGVCDADPWTTSAIYPPVALLPSLRTYAGRASSAMIASSPSRSATSSSSTRPT